MRRLLLTLIVVLPLATFAQQLVNGFSVEIFTGTNFYQTSPTIKIKHEGQDVILDARLKEETACFGGNVYFPFDLGIKQHRFVFAPGIEYQSRKLSLELPNDYIKGGQIKQNLHLTSTTYSPFLLVMYRPHFYIGKLHMSFTIGASVKYIVSNKVELLDGDNATLQEYNKDFNVDEDENYIDFNGNASCNTLANKGLNIDPRIGFDAYINNSLMISIFAIAPDVQTYAKNFKPIRFSLGAGITYLIRTNKITEAQILQQYKK